MRAAPTPAEEDAEASPPAPPTPAEKPSPPPAPRAKAPPGTPLPAAEILPDYKFAHAATESPIIGGNAETRYFTIVYGMIRAHLHEPRNANPATHGGAIVFALDESGNLLERRDRQFERLAHARHGRDERHRRGRALSGAAGLAAQGPAPYLRQVVAVHVMAKRSARTTAPAGTR